MNKVSAPKPQELAAVSALPAPKRYSHFVKHVAGCECVWGLRDAGCWVTVGDDSGQESIPFWPRSEYAQACAISQFPGNSPESVEIHAFLDRWLPGMAKDGVKIAVFPTVSMKGIVVEPQRLEADIRAELELLE